MNRRMRLALLFAVIATAFVILVPGKAGAMRIRPTQPHRQFVSVSLPALRIGAGERVVGFDFDVTSGRIAQITDIPIGWNISADNDASWNTKIHAFVLVAAAALNGSYFKDFAVIERESEAETPFEIRGRSLCPRIFLKCEKSRSG
jgi:hypothetical protein